MVRGKQLRKILQKKRNRDYYPLPLEKQEPIKLTKVSTAPASWEKLPKKPKRLTPEETEHFYAVLADIARS